MGATPTSCPLTCMHELWNVCGGTHTHTQHIHSHTCTLVQTLTFTHSLFVSHRHSNTFALTVGLSQTPTHLKRLDSSPEAALIQLLILSAVVTEGGQSPKSLTLIELLHTLLSVFLLCPPSKHRQHGLCNRSSAVVFIFCFVSSKSRESDSALRPACAVIAKEGSEPSRSLAYKGAKLRHV